MGNCHHHKKNLWAINLEASGNCHQLKKPVGNCPPPGYATHGKSNGWISVY